jgi:uncharacterized protein (TIGR02599 family)
MKTPRIFQFFRRRRAFTLMELMVSVSILLIMLVVLLQILGGVGDVWRNNSGKIAAYQDARSAFSTLSRALSRASLNTYNDYVDAAGNYRDASNYLTFQPASFARASELHFVSGAASELVPGGSETLTPGSCVFFQAPIGETDDVNYTPLDRALNSIGFHIQYSAMDDDTLMPGWLDGLFGEQKQFRLIQIISPTEDLAVYNSTAAKNYDLDWLHDFSFPQNAANQPRARVLASNIPLLVMRPRLVPQDEETLAPKFGEPFSPATQGSFLSPNYHYDSRVWEEQYPASGRVKAYGAGRDQRAAIMRNQVPPIIDVAMVSVDPKSIVKLPANGDAPPAALQVGASLFRDSKLMDQDLETYGQQLSEAKVRYKIFRTSIQVKGAKWSNN